MSERFPFGVDLTSKLNERPQINHKPIREGMLTWMKMPMFSSMLNVPSVHLYTLELSICDLIGDVTFEFPHTKWVGDLGEPTHTLAPYWMPQPLPPRNQYTGWFALDVGGVGLDSLNHKVDMIGFYTGIVIHDG